MTVEKKLSKWNHTIDIFRTTIFLHFLRSRRCTWMRKWDKGTTISSAGTMHRHLFVCTCPSGSEVRPAKRAPFYMPGFYPSYLQVHFETLLLGQDVDEGHQLNSQHVSLSVDEVRTSRSYGSSTGFFAHSSFLCKFAETNMRQYETVPSVYPSIHFSSGCSGCRTKPARVVDCQRAAQYLWRDQQAP